MNRLAQRVARNTSYTLAGNLVAFAAGTVSSVVLARLLGPTRLGAYALVLSTGGVLSMLVVLGLPHAAAKYVAEYDARGERDTAGRVLVALARVEAAAALGAGTLAFLVAPALERAFHAPGFAPAFRIAAVGLLPAVLAGLALAGLQGFHDFRRMTLISVVSTLVLFSSTVGLLIAGAGVAGAVAAQAGTAAVTALLGWRGLRRHARLGTQRTHLPAEGRAKLRRYIPTVSLVLLLDAVVWQRSEVFFLGVFRTPREVAWYALAFGAAATVMSLVPRALSVVLAPVASGLYGGGDRTGMQVLFRTGSRYLVILAGPVVVGGAVLARPLLVTIYGQGYEPAAVALPLLLLAAGFGAVGSVTASIQTGIERQDLVLKVAAAATAANLLLDLTLIPAWGVTGAAVANTAAQVGAVVAGIVLTAPIVGVPFPVRECARVLPATAVMGAAAFLVTGAFGGAGGLAAGVLAGILVYPAALLATGAVWAEDLERFRAVGEILPTPLRPGYGGLLRLAERWAA